MRPGCHHWSDVDDGYLREAWRSLTARQIAAHIGCTVKAVQMRAKKLGVLKRGPYRTCEERERVLGPSDIAGNPRTRCRAKLAPSPEAPRPASDFRAALVAPVDARGVSLDVIPALVPLRRAAPASATSPVPAPPGPREIQRVATKVDECAPAAPPRSPPEPAPATAAAPSPAGPAPRNGRPVSIPPYEPGNNQARLVRAIRGAREELVAGGVDPDTANSVVTLVVRGQTPSLRLNYTAAHPAPDMQSGVYP